MPTDRFHSPSESSRPDHLRRPGPKPPSPLPRTGPGGRPGSAPPPARAPLRQMAAAARASLGTELDELPQPGDWLWACRPGAEDDVRDELAALGITCRPLQAGLLVSAPKTGKRAGSVPAAFSSLTFARQGLPVQLSRKLEGRDLNESAALIVDGLYRGFKNRPIAVHVFSADSDHGKMLSGRCAALHAAISQDLEQRGYSVSANGPTAHSEGGQLLMVCLLAEDTVVAGVQLTSAALSLYPGGVQRVRRPADAPSRSAHKLSEALAWLGHGPQAGEDCVDLGAAPGGWSQVLAERGCAVTAVDTGRLAPGLSRRIKHVQQNAFNYGPDEPADWLCCDLAYRPLEVAALLARWGRRRWARFVIANIKLPMKQRVAMLDRVREILATGGWTGLKVRQLYHDRDEVTLFAWRGFGLDTRVQPRRAASVGEDAAPSPSKPSFKPGSKPSFKPASKPGAKPGSKSGTKPGYKPSAKPASKSGAKPGSKPAGRPSVKAGPPPRRSKSASSPPGRRDTRAPAGGRKPSAGSGRGRRRS